ncbi:MAG: PRD domain-containing protein [Clostridium sp.]|nr:PRD domain-containing protein [Clostridium sp.]
MIIKQILNNNVVISENDNNEEIVVMGRGIAFGAKKGQEIPDDKIQKIFTNEKNCDFNHFTQLISEIDLDNFEFIEDLINYAKVTLGKKLNNSIYITLTDHINTLIERSQVNAYVKNTMLWDIKRIYRDEFRVSRQMVSKINEKLASELDDNEAASITMHIVNAELETNMKTAVDITKTMTDILNIVKYHFKIVYDEESLAYYRFVTHLLFFTQRVFNGKTYTEDKETELFEIVKTKYSEMYKCTLSIKEFLHKEYDYELEDEECLYLTIHIAKVVRESRSL